ncbi:hypothetical protein ACFV6U_09215 [Streptomyces sp. NPDC059810]|uniref:hypothetical protein n=1 Tax=Streptomyces sp. NPDC059810 TaxID=3346956 RepID=UPI00364E380D
MASPEPGETGGELVPLNPRLGGNRPVTPRAEAVIVLAEQGFGRNEIARRSGIPKASVSAIADAYGISFDRTQTKEALKARLTQLREAEMNVARGLLEDIIEARIRLRMTTTDRDFAFQSKALGDLTQAYQRMVPEWSSADTDEDAKSMLGDLMVGIKAFSKEQRAMEAAEARGEEMPDWWHERKNRYKTPEEIQNDEAH